MKKINNLVENFLQALFTDNRPQAKEWRGANIPVGDEDNRPNLIRECMTMEGNQMKIRCLRKLRDQVAMNPFYQARLDRFVDAITDTYEPTNQQGTIPGNEFKASAVGEDMPGHIMEEVVIKENTVLDIVMKRARKASDRYNICMAKAKQNKMFTKNRSYTVAECKYQDHAYLSQQIKRFSAMCSKAKNPDKCKKQVQDIINMNMKEAAKWKAKANALKQKLKR